MNKISKTSEFYIFPLFVLFCITFQFCTNEEIKQYRCITYLNGSVYSTKMVSNCSMCIAPKGYTTSCKQISMTMTKDLKKKIITISSLLSPEQKAKEIVEIENNAKNRILVEYLESIGREYLDFKVVQESQHAHIQEESGRTSLWYKKSDGNWIIKTWEINRLKG